MKNFVAVAWVGILCSVAQAEPSLFGIPDAASKILEVLTEGASTKQPPPSAGVTLTEGEPLEDTPLMQACADGVLEEREIHGLKFTGRERALLFAKHRQTFVREGRGNYLVPRTIDALNSFDRSQAAGYFPGKEPSEQARLYVIGLNNRYCRVILRDQYGYLAKSVESAYTAFENANATHFVVARLAGMIQGRDVVRGKDVDWKSEGKGLALYAATLAPVGWAAKKLRGMKRTSTKVPSLELPRTVPSAGPVAKVANLGTKREQYLARLVNGKEINRKVTAVVDGKKLPTIEVDVIGPKGEFIQVGGGSKTLDKMAGQVDRQLKAARAQGVESWIALEKGTRPEVREAVLKWQAKGKIDRVIFFDDTSFSFVRAGGQSL